MVTLGTDRISEFSHLFEKKRLAIVVNQASLNSSLLDTYSVFVQAGFQVTTLFGPQHGLFGHTQDNMIEWQGDEYEKKNVRIHSLYGEHRKPTPEMLSETDVIVFDVPDVGARYYTFIWTLALLMEAAAEHHKKIVVLDRPNPLGGESVEGPMLDTEFSSFVGLYPLINRHGLTIGEVARWLQKYHIQEVDLEVIPMKGWQRSDWYDQSGLKWIMPSPNMPALSTATVYPGQCLLEATNISEGRGTTRPFEIFGAPWIDNEKMCDFLNINCPGATFQPWFFEPTFHKFERTLCRGAFIHVTDRLLYQSVATTMTILSYLFNTYPEKFEFKAPPYEYEYEKMPFDILMGSDRWRSELSSGIRPAYKWSELWRDDEREWREFREEFLLYS